MHSKPNHAIAVIKDADQYQDEDPIFIKEYLKVKEEKNGSSQRIMTIEKQKARIVEWIKHSEEWARLRTMFEQGKPLRDNVDTHISTFKHVAYLAAEMDQEDEKTKKIFC